MDSMTKLNVISVGNREVIREGIKNPAQAGSSSKIAVTTRQATNATVIKSPPEKQEESCSRRETSRRRRHQIKLDPLVLNFIETKLNYTIFPEQKLGYGAFSEVFKARRNDYELDCAVKVIDMDANPRFRDRFLSRELRILTVIKHPSIIRIFDIAKIINRVYIFMEFATKKDLGTYLKRLNRPLIEVKACKWFVQICQGLDYLHNEKNIAHRDIKINNILISDENHLKLIDFGFAIEVAANNVHHTFCGTKAYLPPQIIKRQSYNPLKADMWSVGIVLFLMLHNRYPFHAKDRSLMLREIFDPEYLPKRILPEVSQSANELMRKLLACQENDRPDVKDVLRHDWIIQFYDPNYEIVVEEELID